MFAVFASVLGVIMFAVWYETQRYKKRQQAMRLASEKLGLAYQPVRPAEYDGRLAKYKLLTVGRDRQSSNFIMASTDELNLILFDQRYTTGSGKNTRRVNQTVAWITSSLLQTPEFSIVPENWFSRLSDLVFKTDIDIPADPEFSKRFLLSGPDAEKIRDFFTLNRRETLLGYQLPTIECFPGEMMFYRPGKLVAPDKIKELMNEAFLLYQAFAATSNSENSSTL
jgi:hypothetical protein